MKKKLLTILLAMTLAFSVTACGNDAAKKTEADLVAAEQMNKYISKSNDSSDITVCETIRTSIQITFSDPDIKDAPSFNIDSYIGTRSFAEFMEINDAVKQYVLECIGYQTVDEVIGDFRSSDASLNTLMVNIEKDEPGPVLITVYIDGTSIGAGSNTALYSK